MIQLFAGDGPQLDDSSDGENLVASDRTLLIRLSESRLKIAVFSACDLHCDGDRNDPAFDAGEEPFLTVVQQVADRTHVLVAEISLPSNVGNGVTASTQGTDLPQQLQRRMVPPGQVLDRTITVRFDSNVTHGLPWKFVPDQETVRIRADRWSP